MVLTTQRLGSRFPNGRRRSVIFLACVSLLTLPAAAARPDGLPTFQNQIREKGAAVRLEPGTPVEKELAGGATDAYEIQVSAGQFLHAVVEQLGIHVALTMYGPDGKQIATMDSPNGTWGIEQLSTIAESAGIFRLEISSGDKNVHSNNYRVSIEALRPPTDADRARIKAERILVQAEELRAQETGDSLKRSRQMFEDTLPLWEAAGDVYEQSLALYTIARFYDSQGDENQALNYFNRALPLARAAGDRHWEATTINYIGLVYHNQGAFQKALDKYNEALAIRRAVGDRRGEAQTLGNIGSVYDSFGDWRKALDYYNQALPIQQALGDLRNVAGTLQNIGLTYFSLGDVTHAIDYYNQALPLRRTMGDRDGEAITLNNLGTAYDLTGEKTRAIEFYNQALAILRDVGDRRGEALVLNNIGHIYFDLNENQKGLDYLMQVLELVRAVGDRRSEAMVLHNLGAVYDSLGQERDALSYLDQALTIERTVGDRYGEAATLTSIGQARASLGENKTALDYYNQGLALQQTIGDRLGEAETLNFIGLMYTALGQRQAALQNYSLSLAEARQVQNPIDEASVLGNLMELWRRDGKPATAAFFGKHAVNKIQQLRANIRGFEKEAQQSFLKSKEKIYRDLADLLITQGRLPEAEQVLDLLKDEEYFEFIRRDSKESSALSTPVKLTKNEETADREYEAKAESVAAIGNEYASLRAKPKRTADEEQHLKELEQHVTAANEAWEKFLASYFEELGKTKEANESVESVSEQASAMQSVLRQLDPGTVALYTLVTDDKYRVMVITPNVMVPREYAIKGDDLRKKVAEFRQALMDPASDPKPKAQELYSILVAPMAKELEGSKAKTLMWSLDGVLRYLPIAALYDGREYLVEKYRNTVFTPSSIPGLAERPNVGAWHGLGMGVSKSYGGFEALPAVPTELRRVIRTEGERKTNGNDKNTSSAAGVVPGQVMLDETFTAENMEKALEKKYPLVHIASHFDFSPGNETGSFLLLGGKEEKGERLTLAELRKNPAFNFSDTELLTLSACNTAVSGSAGDGREVDGIGFLAQRKGARAVVASLWAVYDPSTGVLMEQFYRLWTKHRNMPKAEALREAQLALLRGTPHSTTAHSSGNSAGAADYSHPFYWAPFILIGNWR